MKINDIFKKVLDLTGDNKTIQNEEYSVYLVESIAITEENIESVEKDLNETLQLEKLPGKLFFESFNALDDSKEYGLFYMVEDIEMEGKRGRPPASEEWFKSKYGDEEGQTKWDTYLKRKEYLDGLKNRTPEDIANKPKYVPKGRKPATQEWFINKYGEEKGQIRWDEYLKRKEYITGLANRDPDAPSAKRGRQPYTRELFIKKHGLEKGEEKWNQAQQRRLPKDQQDIIKRGSNKKRGRQSSSVASIISPSAIRKFKSIDDEPTADQSFYCQVIDKFTVRNTCAIGMCGEASCPFYQNAEDQELTIKYLVDKGKAEQFGYSVITDKKTGESHLDIKPWFRFTGGPTKVKEDDVIDQLPMSEVTGLSD